MDWDEYLEFLKRVEKADTDLPGVAPKGRRNVEIKARARDAGALAERVRAIADSGPVVLHQQDTYFHSDRGRLKLRKLSDSEGELIFYNRPNRLEPSECRYSLLPTTEPDRLHDVLLRARELRGRVVKRRVVYLAGQTRVHLDDVEGLGRFVELEVVLTPDQSDSDGERIAQDLMKRLQIREEDLLEKPYIDMLEAAG